MPIDATDAVTTIALSRLVMAAAAALAATGGMAQGSTTPSLSRDESPPAIVFRTIPATPAAAATPSIPVAVPAQPLIRRSSLETGSLIAPHKQCLTRAQWRYVDDQHEAEARRYVADGTTRPNCLNSGTATSCY